MRVFVISLLTLTLLFSGLFLVRQWGLMTPYQRFDHAFLEGEKPFTVVQVSSLEEARQALSHSPNLILWLELRFSKDGQFLILNRGEDENALSIDALGDRWKGNVLSRYSLQDLRLIYPEAQLLEDFLREFPQTRFVLFIKDNANDVHHHLIQLVESHHPEKRFLFHSDADIILSSLKEKQPMWLYGSSYSDLMKILTFESIGLQSASPFQGDVFISALELIGRPAFNEHVLSEIRRREKDIFLGPLRTAEELEAARAFAPDAFIYPSVEIFESLQISSP